MNSLEELDKYDVDHEYLSPIITDYEERNNIFSIIIDCYYGLNLLKKSIESILNQTYTNIELILIDNGAEADVSIYVDHIYRTNKNVALIKFKVNQFCWNDTERMVVVCWNIGVKYSKGSIIGHLAYDDMLSLDCVERMSELFSANSNCVTAAPLPVSVDINGNRNIDMSNNLSLSNQRPKYINGKELAIDYVQHSPNKYFGAPGGILFIKKDIILNTGGFDRSSDITQVIKFAIHGDTGFDPIAKLFWRHHKGQVNKIAKSKGMVWCKDFQDVVKNEKIIEMWDSLFTPDQVMLLSNYVVSSTRYETLTLAKGAIRNKKAATFFLIIKNIAYQCPYLLLFVLGQSILELYKMVHEKYLAKQDVSHR